MSDEFNLNNITIDNLKVQPSNIQIQVALKDNKVIQYLDEQIQKEIVKIDQKYISSCSRDVTIELLANADKSLWEAYAINQNLNYNDLKKLVNDCAKKANNGEYDIFYLYERMSICFNYSNDEFIENALEKEDISTFLAFIKRSNLDIQNKIYKKRNEILKKHYSKPVSKDNKHYNFYISRSFSLDFIKQKFLEIYGSEKLKEYDEILTNFFQKENTQILDFFIYNKSTIVEKIDSNKVIKFLEYYLKENKNTNSEIKQIEEAKQHNDFLDIMKEAYGEEALTILKERIGLEFLDIDNLEVFSKEVLTNFRKGFIHDLLSYQFAEGTFKFTNWCKDEEDLKAFKLYYNRISNKLGSNVITMQLCISKYEEYQDILKEVVRLNIQDEQLLEKLDALCVWPKNIAKINTIEELTNVEEILQQTISTLEEVDLNDFIDFKFYSQSVLYNYFNILNNEEVLKQLNKDELKILLLLKEQNSSKIDLNSLNIANKANISLTNIFMNKYLTLNKIKNIEMKNFQSKIITDKEKIEANIINNKYNVKKIIVDGIEIIDLGEIPVNFASHNPGKYGGSTLEYALGQEAYKTYFTFDKKESTSTFSARSISEKNGDSWFWNGNYIYWDFTDNEIIALYDGSYDAGLAHDNKLIQSYGDTTTALNNYSNMINGNEIGFYRRYRNHDRIETTKYGGKIIPSAIIGTNINEEIIELATKKFGKNIPILCKRGALATEKEQTAMKLEIQNIINRMQIGDYLKENLKIRLQTESSYSEKYWKNFEQKAEFTLQQLNNLGVSENELFELSLSKNINIDVKNKISEKQFEREVGYTIEELHSYGITETELQKLRFKFDPQNGERINRKYKVFNKVLEKQFEREVGYTIEELHSYGITETELQELRIKFDPQNGERINRKAKLESLLSQKYMVEANNNYSNIDEPVSNHKFGR